MNTTTVDCTGLQCPLPILRLSKAMKDAKGGDRVALIATDPGAMKDVTAWAQQTGHKLVEANQGQERYTFLLEKTA